MFVHTHVHTHYSPLDGMGKPEELVKRAKELGMHAIATTDHGNMYGIYDMWRTCKKHGLQYIPGIEFYHKVEGYDDRFHLIALAKTMKGLKTLYKLHKISHKNSEVGKFGKEYPIVTYTDLMQYHEDIIVTTACLGGHIPKLIIQKKYSELDSTISLLKNIFDTNFYFEIQPNDIAEQKSVNIELALLSKKYGVPLVVGCDSHYVLKSDAKVHEMMLCMQTKKFMDSPDRFKFASDDFWLKSEDEVREELRYLDKAVVDNAINNTCVIAELCNFEYELPKQEECLPKYADDEKAMLRQACTQGWAMLSKKSWDIKKYVDRVNYELNVIEEKGYSGYFNIVMDYVNWAKDNGIIVGPGRGSICGSEVAYLSRITSIDPIPLGLLFERFLNPERMSSPDADIDFNDRDKVVQYLKERWGWHNVSSIIAFGTLTAKAVIRKVLGIHKFSQAQINEISKSLPRKLELTLKDCETSPTFNEYKKKYPHLFDAMYRLEGTIDHISQHAAGILITPKEVCEFVPCGYDRENDIQIAGFDKYMLEELGLYKFDILKLETLNVINDTLEMVKKYKGIDIDLNTINYEDAMIYDQLCKGNVFGVFQLESQQYMTMQIAPRNFEALTLLNTLIRPGTGDVEEYIARRDGKDYDIYSHAEDDYMQQALYTIAYQEQIMLRVHTLAGWTLGKGDSLRKVKHIKENGELAEQFINDAQQYNRLTYEQAVQAWMEIVEALDGGYTFNKSHSASYAKIAFQTAWLKYHYPQYFMCALMSAEREDQSKIAERVVQARQLGIDILPPDINKSNEKYNIEGDAIRYAINTIKGVGVTALQEIERLKPVKSLADVFERCNKSIMDKTVFTNLILSGAFDFEDKNRYALMEQYHLLRGEKKIAEAYHGMKMSSKDIAAFEKEKLGLYLTSSPYENYNFKSLTEFTDKKAALIGGEITKIKEIFDKKNRKMAFVTLTTEFGNVEMVLFASDYSKCAGDLIDGAFVMCKGTRDGSKLLLNEINVLEG